MQEGLAREVLSFNNYIATFEKPLGFIMNEQIDVSGEPTTPG
jgi:hypothetical protein